MRNFTWLLIFSCLFFSCSKENQDPGGGAGPKPSNPSTPVTPVKPTTAVTITVNDAPMVIDTLTFNRYGSGEGGGMTITASNAFQKVIAETFNFYQRSPWSMIYTEQVSYFTRTDSLAGWGEGYTRPTPRDDGVEYQNFTPLSDSVVNGTFKGTFNGGGGIVKGGEGQGILVRGNFKLVFIK